jgi:hypothetical protein
VNLSLIPWKYVSAGMATILLLTSIYLGIALHKWDHWKAAAEDLQRQVNTVVIALREATNNPEADWATAPGQIRALGDSNKALKTSITAQNERIDEMAAEAVKLRAHAVELQQIADRAKAQRQAAYTRLSQMAITPGERADCEQLVKEANDALDIVHGAGL